MTPTPEITVPLLLQSYDGRAVHRTGEPVTCGVPWACGAVDDMSLLALRNSDGMLIPWQGRVLETWKDGSIRWLLVDWLADGDLSYQLESYPGVVPPSAVSAPILVTEGQQSIEIATGKYSWRLEVGKRFPFFKASINAQLVIDPSGGGIRIQDQSGKVHWLKTTSFSVYEAGPIRSCVRAEGQFKESSGTGRLDVFAYLHFFAGSPTVRVNLTLMNPTRAHHPNGHWVLGQSSSVLLQDVSYHLNNTSGPSQHWQFECSPEPLEERFVSDVPVGIYQDSSGGENWNSPTHKNRNGEVPMSFNGYQITNGQADTERTARRATPTLAMVSKGNQFAICMQHFWQNFPKEISASTRRLSLGLFPKKFDDLHEIQGGEQKTHVFHVSFANDGISDTPLDWARSPLVASPVAECFASGDAVPYLTPQAEDPHPKYIGLVNCALEGENSFERKREVIDEYDWRNFGDIYADHEALFFKGENPLISHYNNQYDSIRGFAIQFMRSNDVRWYRLMCELARHVIDIDVYHSVGDKAAYNKGLFWHTAHYVDAATSTHRSFPAEDGVHGGGPSPGHLYATGLLLHYLFTGDPQSRETVLSFGQYVIDCDDGSKTIFRWLDRSHTGHASESGMDRYHGPGRTPGNAIAVLMDADRLAEDDRFIRKAEQLIRRCINPTDDLAKRNLQDIENRWFYTIFIKSLDYYLRRKNERGEWDEMYSYARESLLHYARWAVENESLYLNKPELLEYPNETWAAQELHKTEMFNIAAKHTDGDEREAFRIRAASFFESSIDTLAQTETHALSRPMALLMSFGYGQAYFAKYGVPDKARADLSPAPSSLPSSFEPQKRRAFRRFVLLAASGFMILVAIVINIATNQG